MPVIQRQKRQHNQKTLAPNSPVAFILGFDHVTCHVTIILQLDLTRFSFKDSSRRTKGNERQCQSIMVSYTDLKTLKREEKPFVLVNKSKWS